MMQNAPVLYARLPNSEVLGDLENYLYHLSGDNVVADALSRVP